MDEQSHEVNKVQERKRVNRSELRRKKILSSGNSRLNYLTNSGNHTSPTNEPLVMKTEDIDNQISDFTPSVNSPLISDESLSPQHGLIDHDPEEKLLEYISQNPLLAEEKQHQEDQVPSFIARILSLLLGLFVGIIRSSNGNNDYLSSWVLYVILDYLLVWRHRSSSISTSKLVSILMEEAVMYIIGHILFLIIKEIALSILA